MQLFENALDLRQIKREWREPLTRASSGVCEQLSRIGLTAWLGHDLDFVAGMQRASQGRMRRLAECVDPTLNPSHDESNTLVVALKRGDEPVACTAIRYRQFDGTLADGISSGSALSEIVRADHRMVCARSDLLHHDIQDASMAWSGGSYTEPGAEAEMFPGLMRLAFVGALGRWHWQWLAGMCERGLGDRDWSFDRLGMQRVENGVKRIEPDKLTRYAVVAMRRRTLLAACLKPTYGDFAVSLGEEPDE